MGIEEKIKIAIDAADAETDVRELSKRLRELNSLALQVAETNQDAFNSLAEAGGRVQDRLSEVREQMSAMASGSGVEKMSNSFGVLSGQVANLDFDGAAKSLSLFNNNLKNMNLADFGNGLKSLGTQFLNLGKVIMANPIFRIAAIVIAIIGALVALKDSVGFISRAFEAMGEVIKFITDALYALTDALGITAKAAEKAVEKQKKGLEELKTAYDQQIAVMKAAGEQTYETEIKKLEASKQSTQVIIDNLNHINEVMGKLTDDQKKDLEEAKKNMADYSNQIKVLNATAYKASKDKAEEYMLEIKKINIELLGSERDKANKTIELDNEEKKKKIRNELIGLEHTRKVLQQQYNDYVALYKALGMQPTMVDVFTKGIKTQLDGATGAVNTANEYIKKIDEQTKHKLNESNEKFDKEAADKAKSNAEKAKAELQKKLQAELKLIDDTGKLEVLNTSENSEERLKVQKDTLDKISTFYKEHYKQLDMTETEMKLKVAENNEEKKKLTKDYTEYVTKLENDKNMALAQLGVLHAHTFKEQMDAEIGVIQQSLSQELQDRTLTEAQRQFMTEEAEAKIKEIKDNYRQQERDAEINNLQGVIDGKRAILDAQKEKDLGLQLSIIDSELALNRQKLQQLEREELEFAEKHGLDVNNIKRKYRDMDRAAEIDAENQRADAFKESWDRRLNYAQMGADALSNLSSLVMNTETGNSKKTEAERLKAAKKAFELNKKTAAVSTVIQTARGIMAASPNIPLMLWTGVTGALSLAKILSQKFDGGGASTSSPSAPSGSSGSSGSEASSSFKAPTFFNLGQQQQTAGGNQPIVIENVISENSITSTQNNVGKIKSRAGIKYGG